MHPDPKPSFAEDENDLFHPEGILHPKGGLVHLGDIVAKSESLEILQSLKDEKRKKKNWDLAEEEERVEEEEHNL